MTDLHFETPLYANYPAMLVHLGAVSDEELINRLECAWMEKAPVKLAKQYQQKLRQQTKKND